MWDLSFVLLFTTLLAVNHVDMSENLQQIWLISLVEKRQRAQVESLRVAVLHCGAYQRFEGCQEHNAYLV